MVLVIRVQTRCKTTHQGKTSCHEDPGNCRPTWDSVSFSPLFLRLLISAFLDFSTCLNLRGQGQVVGLKDKVHPKCTIFFFTSKNYFRLILKARVVGHHRTETTLSEDLVFFTAQCFKVLSNLCHLLVHDGYDDEDGGGSDGDDAIMGHLLVWMITMTILMVVII